MKILVTGGYGFIGGHVVDEIARRGHKAVVFDRHQPKDKTLMPEAEHDFFMGDIRDRNAINEAVSKVDRAINLAGILGTSETVDNPFPAAETNIFGGLNFLDACRKHGVRGAQIAVGNHFMNNTYAISKTTIERFALMFNKEHGTKIAVVRGLNAYGERQKHKPVRKITPNFVCQSLRGEAIKVFGSGESIMDMVYVKDLAYYLVESVLADEALMDYQTVYSAGSGVETTVNQIADIINGITGNKTPVNHTEMRAGETDNSVVLGDPSTLTFAKDYVQMDIKNGMEKTVRWYKENYNWQQD